MVNQQSLKRNYAPTYAITAPARGNFRGFNNRPQNFRGTNNRPFNRAPSNAPNYVNPRFSNPANRNMQRPAPNFSRPFQPRFQNPVPQNNRFPNAVYPNRMDLCFYHRTFGREARNHELPCAWIFPAKNDK